MLENVNRIQLQEVDLITGDLFGYIACLVITQKDWLQPVATGLLSVAPFDSNEATGNWHVLRLMQLQLEVQSLPVGLCWVSGLFEVHRTGPVNTIAPSLFDS